MKAVATNIICLLFILEKTYITYRTFDMIHVIAFDADDTLWANEPIFDNAQARCQEMLSDFIPPEELNDKLYGRQIENLRLFGYGIKGFTLSMIESVIELSEGRVSGAQIQQIIEVSKEMLQHPVDLLPNVKETLNALQHDYRLMIITKGDLFDQESKIARSGISEYFEHVEIVSNKTTETYQRILDKHEIIPEHFLMVGNSLKSDILPVCEAGATAIHIPFHTTWGHEMVSRHELEGHNYRELADISLLPAFLNSLSDR